jgi:uncharacterized protein involved in exopolysaccharide biosynthesis
MDTLEQEEQTLDVRKYIDIALRHWWIIILPPIITTIAAFFWSINLPKVYEASTLILVENRKLLNPLIQGIAVTTSVQEQMSSLREEILSWPRLVQLIERLELDKDPEGPKSIEVLLRRLKETITVNMNKNNMIIISYEDQDPRQAQKVVLALSDILITSNRSSQSADAEGAIDFIKEQLDDYRLKLEESEAALRQFKEAYTISLPVAARVNEQIIDLEIELNQLLIENTEEHPSVVALRKKIELLKGEREKELSRMENQGIGVRDDDFQAIAYSVPRQEQELARLKRDTEVNAGLYEQLLQRYESAKISKRLDTSEEGTRFRVIEPPRLPYKPIKPNVPRIIIFGCALGLGLGAGIVFLLEVANSSFRSVEEAKKALPLPILGSIATIDRERMEKAYESRRVAEEKEKQNAALKNKNIFIKIAKKLGL